MNKVCNACPQRMCEHRNALIHKCWFEKDSEQISEFIKDKISKTMNFTAEQLQAGVQRLYSDIDKCITELIKARLSHDEYAEGKVKWRGLRLVFVPTEMKMEKDGDKMNFTYEQRYELWQRDKKIF